MGSAGDCRSWAPVLRTLADHQAFTPGECGQCLSFVDAL